MKNTCLKITTDEIPSFLKKANYYESIWIVERKENDSHKTNVTEKIQKIPDGSDNYIKSQEITQKTLYKAWVTQIDYNSMTLTKHTIPFTFPDYFDYYEGQIIIIGGYKYDNNILFLEQYKNYTSNLPPVKLDNCFYNDSKIKIFTFHSDLKFFDLFPISRYFIKGFQALVNYCDSNNSYSLKLIPTWSRRIQLYGLLLLVCYITSSFIFDLDYSLESYIAIIALSFFKLLITNNSWVKIRKVVDDQIEKFDNDFNQKLNKYYSDSILDDIAEMYNNPNTPVNITQIHDERQVNVQYMSITPNQGNATSGINDFVEPDDTYSNNAEEISHNAPNLLSEKVITYIDGITLNEICWAIYGDNLRNKDLKRITSKYTKRFIRGKQKNPTHGTLYPLFSLLENRAGVYDLKSVTQILIKCYFDEIKKSPLIESDAGLQKRLVLYSNKYPTS